MLRPRTRGGCVVSRGVGEQQEDVECGATHMEDHYLPHCGMSL